jgi:hypothetical protein
MKLLDRSQGTASPDAQKLQRALAGKRLDRDGSVLAPGGGLVDERGHDSQLVTDALLMAVWRRGKPSA